MPPRDGYPDACLNILEERLDPTEVRHPKDCPCLSRILTSELTENLGAGSGQYTVTDAINGWTAEAKDYNPQNPIYSHFTQVVWKNTKQLGCAVVTCPAGSIFDAKYGVRTLSPIFIH